MCTTMTAATRGAKTSRSPPVRAPHVATANWANKSGGEYAPENYHLDSFQLAKKRKVGDVGHKSTGNNALVEPDFSWNLDAIFDNDITVDLFLKAFQEDSGLAMRNDDDAFKFNNWQSAPVETRLEYRTILGIF